MDKNFQTKPFVKSSFIKKNQNLLLNEQFLPNKKKLEFQDEIRVKKYSF